MSFIEKRNIATCIVLSVVTCGIYQIYWVFKVVSEAVKVKDETDNGLLEILLSIFLAPVGLFLAEKKLYEGAAEKGLALADNSIIYLIISIFCMPIIALALMQNDLNKLADCVPVSPNGGTGYFDATNQFNSNNYNNNGGFNPNGGNDSYNGFDPNNNNRQF